MKNYIFTLFVICSFYINAQTVNGIKLKDIPVKYVILQVQNKGPYDINITLDYGQMNSLKDKKGFIVDENEKRIKFNSPISVINFFEKKGFLLTTKMITYTPYYSLIFENSNYKNN